LIFFGINQNGQWKKLELIWINNLVKKSYTEVLNYVPLIEGIILRQIEFNIKMDQWVIGNYASSASRNIYYDKSKWTNEV
jgi:hypothetical protein